LKLLEHIRDGLIEEEHYGFIKYLGNGIISSVGNDNNYPYFLRSCAKPLQASLLCDLGFIDELTDEQIAICCASHAGEDIHVEMVQSILKQYNISEDYLKCGVQFPVSETAKNTLLKENKKPLQIHNNCSGKHAMMLMITKKMGWDLDSYYKLEHPLQQMIKKKINELCDVKKDYPITKDGCGVPIFSMPLINILKGYINLFSDVKYSKIKEAFQKNPYLIGGENRLDTAIMTKNNNLIAKVGAGGLCTVFNIEKKSAIIVKISDCDMKARAICTIKCLRDLNWIKFETDLIKNQDKRDILTINGSMVGKIQPCFSLNINNSEHVL
jgi:L-asparaginase II